MFRLSLLAVLLALCVSVASAQQYEFCYTLQGGASPTTGGYAVWSRGYLWTAGSDSPITITNTAITRTVINAVGQRHTEQLSGIVPTNNRVDQLLFLTPPAGSGYVDGSGIQLPINGTSDPVNGIGTLLGYDLSVPATFVTAYGQNSQLNANINLLFTGLDQYGERLDAGGTTIAVDSSWFYLKAYDPSSPITNCSITIYQPLCVNYPATPPEGSVLFNVTLKAPWSALPAAYIGDLFTALTVALLPGNSQAQFLGFFLFSCYPILSKTSLAQPQVWFYLNSQSAAAMGLSVSTVAQTVYSALQPSSTAINNAYLPAIEQGLIASTSCPLLFTGGQFQSYQGIAGCAVSTAMSSSAAVAPAPTSNDNGGSSGLSHGAIAGIVIGSVVGVTLLLFILFFLMRCMGGSSSGKKETTVQTVPAGGVNHKRFDDETSQVSHTTGDGVELA